ncbi:MAG TPA: aminofutalosine synthase MqnE [Candidatus Saccharimonadales bacterium]|nr:aminofutalosine synthase MqnE [Candidatus Saccharimonadales bacterium]
MTAPSLSRMEEAAERVGLAGVFRKVVDEQRLSGDDGAALYRCDDINLLGGMANLVRERRSGRLAYFVRNQHINYTNICNKDCDFCAFYVRAKDPSGYVLSPEDVRRRVTEQIDEPVTEIHMVAGINPRLPYDYYLDIVRAVKETRPAVTVKAFTMIELEEIARVARKPREAVLEELKAAGLGSLPGGGAEVLSDRVHAEIFPKKLTPAEWLGWARSAHLAGLRSNCTMLYGHIETVEERVEHLLKVRELQDETGGFLTFIPLAFHPDNTEMSHLPPTTGMLDLKQIAVARLMLDNFDHVKSFWIMVTLAITQLTLWYGADDIDGTILREEITHAAGAVTPQALTHREMIAMIREAGREPVERDALYNVIWRDTPQAPAGGNGRDARPVVAAGGAGA